MSRKILKDLEIEEALDEIFGLPENPEESDDDNESEGEEQYSTARLESILQGLDDEVTIPNNPETAALQDKPQNENCSSCPNFSGNTETNTDPQPPVLPSCSGTRPLSPDSPVSDNLSSSSDSDSESDADEMVWKKEKWTSRPEPQFFDEQPISAKRRFTNKTKPIRFFESFFSDKVYELIVLQTNLYAEQRNIATWTPLTQQELKAFLGILIIMGYHVLPSIDLYWSSDPGFRLDEVANVMPIKRFKKILRCLHLNDNEHQPAKNMPGYDKLYKLRPLIDLINESCQNNCTDSGSQSIDESMILFKGRSSLKQYMPMKPIKRGYKVWCRCDSQSGYLFEFQIYSVNINWLFSRSEMTLNRSYNRLIYIKKIRLNKWQINNIYKQNSKVT